MKETMRKHFFWSLLLLILLSAAIACSATACANSDVEEESGTTSETVVTTESGTGSETELTVLGTGQTQISVEVHHLDGTVKSFTVKTDKTTVADALVEVGLVSGEDSQYGLYILTVDGEYHKWEDDGKFWAFYVNGESSMVGAGSVNVTTGDTYAFKAE